MGFRDEGLVGFEKGLIWVLVRVDQGSYLVRGLIQMYQAFTV